MILFSLKYFTKGLFYSQFPLFFSDATQMALMTLSKALEKILKNLQNFEICTHGFEGTIINILVALNFLTIFEFFSNALQMALATLTKTFALILENLPKNNL